MLRPVQMSRVVVAGSKDVMEPVIEKLHELNLMHLVNYSGGQQSFEPGKTVGRGKEFSENLIKLRSVSRYLDIKSKAPDVKFGESEIVSQMDDLLGRLGDDVTQTYERIAAIDAEVKTKQDQINALRPLSVLPVPLELYQGYDSLAVFVGTVASAVDAEVAKISSNSEVFSGSYKNGLVAAVFAPIGQAADVQAVLAGHGYSEISVPKLSGTPDAAIASLEAESKNLLSEKEPLVKKLKDLRKQNEDKILAADEYLSMQTQKTDAPLRFATSNNAFVIDGYVPTAEFERFKSSIEGAAGGKVHVEKLSDAEMEKCVESGEDVPSKMDNPGIVKPFELITRLFSIPEYKEFDPTLLIFIFFPIMFGMILGDVGYGLMILVVVALLKKKFRTEGWNQLINIVIISSVWAIIFGVVFGELFGPMGLWGKVFGQMAHEEILALEESGLFWGEGFFGPLGRIGPAEMFPMYRLATNAVLMLIGVSIFIGVLHCSVGSILGIKTELNYGEKKHAYFERLPVLIFQVAFALLLLGLIMGVMPIVYIMALLIVVSIVMLVMGPEGVMGATHLPFYVSNLISYLRLLAIGLASVGVAFAANKLAFQVLMPMLSGGEHLTMVAYVLGVVVLLMVHFINVLLGILSPFMHPLRLHYVEMFTKFYAQRGGGVEYSPFGHVRRYLKA
ncbi:MAG: V-type ATP synthase subunit I [Methanosaeta sp. PtaB.Bin039]|nr:MAG: V-type ATP synthase subunit I [Methanosaeta sp. PtaB.Bin039]HOT07432.1 V-type ATP synthase subunit I [Methanotrichaceae archaeon]HQF17391.1 V-type ATP synthase subunit I [Methanotrichaceae archaeon]HQI91153.1 V-type ATP synthase subunit I [Methanotrichaceae archaeon]HQJ29222.1 V-type ATP synthase subunit I [Methanotrichaceae archaeon]